MSAAGGNRLREGDHESPGPMGAPATGQRHLSLWEQMLEALDMEFTRNLMEPHDQSEAGYQPTTPTGSNGKTASKTASENADEDDSEDDDDDDREVGGPMDRDGTIGRDRETNGRANAAHKRSRAGLYATLGELAGVGRQGRHAR